MERSDELTTPARRTETINGSAYENYRKGRQFFHIGAKASFMVATRMSQKSVEQAPQYALAFSSLALRVALKRSCHAIEIEVRDIVSASARAVELDPLLAGSHAALGNATGISADSGGK